MLSKTTRLSIALLIITGFTPLTQLNARSEFSIYQEVKDEYLKTFAQEKKNLFIMTTKKSKNRNLLLKN